MGRQRGGDGGIQPVGSGEVDGLEHRVHAIARYWTAREAQDVVVRRRRGAGGLSCAVRLSMASSPAVECVRVVVQRGLFVRRARDQRAEAADAPARRHLLRALGPRALAWLIGRGQRVAVAIRQVGELPSPAGRRACSPRTSARQ